MENHEIHMENKGRIAITEVTAVEAFDEEAILVDLADEGLIINGKDLHIEMLDLDAGKLVAQGEISGLTYTKKKKKTGILDRLKKR